MKQLEDKPRWFFVDEAGDPVFYGNGKVLIVGIEGCSRTFSVGFLRSYAPQDIRSKLAEVRLEVLNERYFKSIPSITKTLRAFHAKDDCPEVRRLVFSALDKMDFGAQIVVGRKIESIFKKNHEASYDKFYCELVSKLFRHQLHLSTTNAIIFARRGNKVQQHGLRAAVNRGAEEFRRKNSGAPATTISIETSQPVQEPVLQAADYVLWSVQRAFEKGEMRYFDYLRDKIELVWDIFDHKKVAQGQKVIYDRKNNPFDIKSASPLS